MKTIPQVRVDANPPFKIFKPVAEQADAKRYLLPSTPVAAPVRQETYDTLHAPALPSELEPKLWPAVPKEVVLLAPSPAPVLALASKTISVSLLSSTPKSRHRARWPRRTAPRKVERNTMFGSFGAIHAAATLRELDPRGAERRWGYSDVYWGGRGRGHRGRRRRGMLVDQEIGADAMTGAPRSLVLAFATEIPHPIGQLQLRVDRFAIAATRTLAPLFVFIYVLQADPRLVLQVTRADMCLPDDAPHLEGLCSRAVDLPIKDMIREELELELGEGRNLDLDSDIGDEDRIIGQIQDFIDENDDIFRAKDREKRTASSRPSTTASSRSTSTTNRQFAETPHTSSLTANARGTSTSLRNSMINWSEGSRARELERITDAVAVVDPFPLKKRCGKKAHKTTRQAAASVSLETVVGHIRRFVQNLGSAPTLSLPPTARNTRNSVLSGAHAFSLKSQSEGKDPARFTRLIKTTMNSGMSHGFWSSRRRMAAVVQWKRKGNAGRKIRPRDGNDSDEMVLVHEEGRPSESAKKTFFEIEIESVQTYKAPPGPLTLLLLRKLASEDANFKGIKRTGGEDLNRGVEGLVEGGFCKYGQRRLHILLPCFFWERMVRFEDAAETAALDCGTGSTGFAHFGFFVRTAANGDQEGEGQGDGRVLDCPVLDKTCCTSVMNDSVLAEAGDREGPRLRGALASTFLAGVIGKDYSRTVIDTVRQTNWSREGGHKNAAESIAAQHQPSCPTGVKTRPDWNRAAAKGTAEQHRQDPEHVHQDARMPIPHLTAIKTRLSVPAKITSKEITHREKRRRQYGKAVATSPWSTWNGRERLNNRERGELMRRLTSLTIDASSWVLILGILGHLTTHQTQAVNAVHRERDRRPGGEMLYAHLGRVPSGLPADFRAPHPVGVNDPW
ncbi:hypothetical protein EDB85DRAFT_1892323 [Lactarius pseudohatsudake]|nr:hypothetical protein EDB85DRAFT_1892323 [Lactarius pseudohatsudake]